MRGFSLVEVLVSLVVLGVGILGAGAAALRAAALLNTAAREEAITSLAAVLLDSLAAAPEPHDGAGEWGPLRAAWNVQGGEALRRIELTIDVIGLPAVRTGFAALHAAPLPAWPGSTTP